MIRDRDDPHAGPPDRNRTQSVFDGKPAEVMGFGDFAGEIPKSFGRERLGRVVVEFEQFAVAWMTFRTGGPHEDAGASAGVLPDRRITMRFHRTRDEGDVDLGC